MHLSEPLRALTEMRRVLRLSGIVGIRDCDWGGRIHAPITPLLERWYTLTVRVRQHNGGALTVEERDIRADILAGLIADKGGEQQIGTAERILPRSSAVMWLYWSHSTKPSTESSRTIKRPRSVPMQTFNADHRLRAVFSPFRRFVG
jgi:hypothetical protein